MLVKDYIEFLDLLWKRVRPDLLFPPPPLPEGEKPPPIFSTTMFKGEDKKKTQKCRRNRRRTPPAATAAADSSSSFPIPAPGVLENAAYNGGLPSSRLFGRPPPPRPLPPPRTPTGLLALHIPGFRPKEAQRAAWVRKGGLIDPEVQKMLRPEADLAGLGGGDVESSCGREMRPEQDLGQKEAGESGWEKGGRQGLLAVGVVGEREASSSGRPDAGGRVGRKGANEKKDMDSVWDFATRNFPVDPREV